MYETTEKLPVGCNSLGLYVNRAGYECEKFIYHDIEIVFNDEGEGMYSIGEKSFDTLAKAVLAIDTNEINDLKVSKKQILATSNTVRELITKLLAYDMNTPVVICEVGEKIDWLKGEGIQHISGVRSAGCNLTGDRRVELVFEK